MSYATVITSSLLEIGSNLTAKPYVNLIKSWRVAIIIF